MREQATTPNLLGKLAAAIGESQALASERAAPKADALVDWALEQDDDPQRADRIERDAWNDQ